ncbi:cuticle protein CP14.6-like [Papilio machaon]|uniref:cuticle protein CP14.6-like n=1 Tax=Papilio machaon TaxID=76193 RepID=UPI001E6640FC|nr:cuticle protein CP14.6-like [Papilio machaon]
MYRILMVLTLSVFSIGARNLSDAEAKIVYYKNENNGVGNYHFRFETSNGIVKEETGRRVNIGQMDEHVAVKGSYSYNDTEGVLQTVHYKADTNGFVIINPIDEGVNILVPSAAYFLLLLLIFWFIFLYKTSFGSRLCSYCIRILTVEPYGGDMFPSTVNSIILSYDDVGYNTLSACSIDRHGH